MIKLLLLPLVIFNLWAIEVDYKTLEAIIEENPQAYKEKTLLAKYYIKNDNNLKASVLLEDILEAEPRNKSAIALKKQIEIREHTKSVFREAGLSTPINSTDVQKRLSSYYTANNYQFYSTLYQAVVAIKIQLEDSYHIKAAYIYLWDTRYKLSEKALLELHQENNIDAAKIRADICYFTGKYNCSARVFEKLYKTSNKTDYAIKLINSYIYLGQITKAQRLYNFLYRKHPNNSELSKIGTKLSLSKNNYLINMKKTYEKDRNIKTLTSYANALYAANKRQETTDVISEYNKKYASNESLLLQAKYLIWMGETDSALEILKHGSLNNDLQAKLMLGRVYSWEHKFKASKKNLNEVMAKTKDAEQLYSAKKARAYVYMWEEEKELAKKSFTKLLRQKSDDKEVKEALMELNHDYSGLIKIYKKRVNSKGGSTYTKRLGELYTLNKQPAMAMKYLKKYVKNNPTDLESTKALALLLVDNKEYYQGFGYLEYYAAQKQTADSAILLAKNYYWHGFSKEALDVLDALLKKEPKNKEALKLKAKILKISPRFTTSNSGATTGMYFNDLSKKQLFLADTLYFNSHYKASLQYYENYLENQPNDHDARYRYAFALENAKLHGKAEGEFSLLFWTKDSDELRYHYAYNMMKNGKLQKSKELLLKLKSTIYKKIDPKLNSFLRSWEKGWQSQKFSEYASHYDESFLNDEIWAYAKQQKFADVSYISVAIYDPIYKALDDNNYLIQFYQEYSTNRSSDKGYKTLHVTCAANKTECRITEESWEKREYKKSLLLTPYIDRALKDIEYYKAHPLALNQTKNKQTRKSKKKSLVVKNITILS